MHKEEFQTKSEMKSKNLGSGLKKLVSIRLIGLKFFLFGKESMLWSECLFLPKIPMLIR